MKTKLFALLLALAMLTAILPMAAVAEADRPTLTYWCLFENNASKSVDNYADLPMYQELMNRLNTNIVFTHPPTGMDKEQFSLLIASSSLPDIIEYDWYSRYPEGPQAAIDDGVIISLNEYLENGSLPNLAKVFENDPELAATCRTYEGDYYVFPFIRSDELMVQKGGGPTVRLDVLQKLGLDLPETIADWEEFFAKAQEIGYEHPFIARYDDIHGSSMSSSESVFLGAYGTYYTFFVDDGKIKFGPIEDGYKDYLIKMADWYAKGYIDPDFLTLDNSGLDGKMTGDICVATYRSPDSGIGVWTKNMQATNPDVVFCAAKFPVLNEGDTRYFGAMNLRYQAAYSAAITTSCKDVEAALKLLDYAYSEEGRLLYNFGVEGISFEYDENGTPQFTDLIRNNPDGLSLKEAMILWCRNSAGGPFEKDAGPILAQRVGNQYQYDAPFFWDASIDWSKNLPRMVYSGEENSALNDIMNEIDTILEEMTVKIIIGDQSADAYDDYVATMKEAGIEEAIEIVQTAYDRMSK